MYDVMIKFTNGDEVLVYKVNEVLEIFNDDRETATYSAKEFSSIQTYSNFGYSFISENQILTALGMKIEYLVFTKSQK